jgi:hypothetical protein
MKLQIAKLKDQRTNWKYILIVLFVASIVGGALGYLWWTNKKITLFKEKPKGAEKKGMHPKELIEWKVQDRIAQVEIIVRVNKIDESKTDIFVKDLKTSQESFFITLSGIDLNKFYENGAEFRNEHLYIKKPNGLWKYSRSDEKGTLIFETENEFYFTVSPDENFLAIIKNPWVPIIGRLIIAGQAKGLRKEFNPLELATNEMISFQHKISETNQLVLHLEIEERGEWASNSEDFWGFTFLVSSAEPAVPVAYSIFKINTRSWNVKKFQIPFDGFFYDPNLNPERKAVLYERVSKEKELSLSLYNLESEEERILVFYPKEVFMKYYSEAYEYFWSWQFGGEDRRLKAEWVDNNTISYLDFVTRKKIILKVAQLYE